MNCEKCQTPLTPKEKRKINELQEHSHPRIICDECVETDRIQNYLQDDFDFHDSDFAI